MNKYQEALDYLVSNGTHETLNSWGDMIEVETEHGEESLNLLQELVDKGTPMKTLCRELQYQINGKPIVIGLCPTCDSFTGSKDIFCSQCGQRLDWSNDNEL